jgi:hypothetical protein
MKASRKTETARTHIETTFSGRSRFSRGQRTAASRRHSRRSVNHHESPPPIQVQPHLTEARGSAQAEVFKEPIQVHTRHNRQFPRSTIAATSSIVVGSADRLPATT